MTKPNIPYNDYQHIPTQELQRRIQYDQFLMKQPSLHTMTHHKIVTDRKNCEHELTKREQQ